MTPHKTLLCKKVLYLAEHSKGNRVTAGFRTILKFLIEGNWVFGFADVMVVTSKKKRKEFYVLKGLNSKSFIMVVCNPDKVNPSFRPDVLWIDDTNLLQTEVDQLVRMFKRQSDCHIMYSGKKSKTANMKMVVDTREQKPLWKKHESKIIKLDYGDYTTEKLFNVFHIERKSLEDLYGTILKGHIRFRKECIGANANNVRLSLYVEGSKKNFAAKKFSNGHRRQCSGQTLIKIIDTIESRWPLEVVWCGSRMKAKKMIYKRLQQEERKLS